MHVLAPVPLLVMTLHAVHRGSLNCVARGLRKGIESSQRLSCLISRAIRTCVEGRLLGPCWFLALAVLFTFVIALFPSFAPLLTADSDAGRYTF